jgi:hypothetical protein
MPKPLPLFFILIVGFISCKKGDDCSNETIKCETQLLYKILDSTLSSSRENRILFYYNNSNLMDSMIFQDQQTSGNTSPSWSYARFWNHYNSSNQATSVTRKSPTFPETNYCDITYNNNGTINSATSYGFTYKFTYDVSGKLVCDSQYNSFGMWDLVYSYEYDTRGNVIRMITKSRISNSIHISNYTYDSAINPLYNKISLSLPVPSPSYLSRNNETSLDTYSTTYTYNKCNLPVKARIFIAGILEPLVRTYVYY